MNSWQAIDVNSRGSLTAVSSVDDTTIVRLVADPVTGALLVSGASGGTGGQAYSETPGGAIDGSNKTYTTQNPIGTVLTLNYNGEFIDPSQYTVSGSGFTMGTALPVIPNAAFTIVYQGTSSIPTGTGINPQTPSGTVNGVNTTFTCTGIVSVAFRDGSPDPSATITGATNSTIVYSAPPQEYVFAI